MSFIISKEINYLQSVDGDFWCIMPQTSTVDAAYGDTTYGAEYAYGYAATYGAVFPWNSRDTTALDATAGAATSGALYAKYCGSGSAKAIAKRATKARRICKELFTNISIRYNFLRLILCLIGFSPSDTVSINEKRKMNGKANLRI